MLDMNENASTDVKRLALESVELNSSGSEQVPVECCQEPESLANTSHGDVFTEKVLQEKECSEDASKEVSQTSAEEKDKKVIKQSTSLASEGGEEDKTDNQSSGTEYEKILEEGISQRLILRYENTAEDKMISQPPTMILTGKEETPVTQPSNVEYVRTRQDQVISHLSNITAEEIVESQIPGQPSSSGFKHVVESRMTTEQLTLEPEGTEEEKIAFAPLEIEAQKQEVNILTATLIYEGTDEEEVTHPSPLKSSVMVVENIITQPNHTKDEETRNNTVSTLSLHTEHEKTEEDMVAVYSHIEEPAGTENKSIFKCSTATESEAMWRQSGVTYPAAVGYGGHPLPNYSDIISSCETRSFPPSGTTLSVSSLPCPLSDTNEITTRHRRTSMKSGRTPPGTPVEEKKFVRFADALGLELTKVKTFCNEAIPNVPKSAFDDLENVPFSFYKIVQNQTVVATNLIPIFIQPVGLPDFLQRVRDDRVCLENAMAIDDHTITGIVRVLNIHYIKSVYVRYTCDEWRTFSEVRADYVPNSHDVFSDKFSFVFCPPLNVGERTMFAVRYHCAGQLFWDNNFKENYIFICLKKRPNRPSVVYTSSPFIT